MSQPAHSQSQSVLPGQPHLSEGALAPGGRLAPTPQALHRLPALEDVLLTANTKAAPKVTPQQDETNDFDTLEHVAKVNLIRLDIASVPQEIPDFNSPGASKDNLIAQWLIHWIQDGLASGQMTENHLLPRKNDLAAHLGVSIGTVQNAIRFVEDEGHVESKQRIGTLIRDMRRLGLRMRKQTSKRDQAVQAVQVLVVRQGYRIGEFLPSAREIAKMIGTAPNTTRLALEFLSGQGVLESLGTRGNKANWLLQRIPQLEAGAHLQVIESETLIDKIERELKTFIADTCKVGDKLASHLELADHFKVSIKTVHDAMKRLADQGILQSKRGRYGTFILRIPEAGKFYDPSRYNLFVPAKASHFYNYEKVERQMRALIANCCAVGDKLPTMGHLSDLLGVSANTIRKALQNMAKQGVVSFSRGRYGGTFVLLRPDVPEEDIAAIRALLPTQEQADATAVAPPYTWVSINPETLAHIQVQPEEDLQSAQHGSKAP